MSKKKTHEEFVNEINEFTKGEYSVLEPYVGNKVKLLMRHNNVNCDSHEWKINPNNFLSGQRCPICSKKIADEMHRRGIDYFKNEVKIVTNGEYEVIGDIYINNKTLIKVKHILCDTIFEVTPNNFLSKQSRCPKCAILYKANKLRKSIEQVRDDIYNVVKDEYELISKTYINCQSNIMIKHIKCNNIFSVTLGNFVSGGTRCECETQSKGEKAITIYLLEHNINFIPQYKFDDCKNIYQLPFDFYLHNYNSLIEFQGRQHYMPVSIFGGEIGFKKQVKNDNIKRDYCKIHNIDLLEISYKDIDNINIILDNHINSHDNTVPSLLCISK